jgi:hypothetical protein
MASFEQSGFVRAVRSVPINNAIYEYLVGTFADTQPHREQLLNSAELTSDAATQVFNEYSAAVHQIVQTIAPRVNNLVVSAYELASLTSSLITTIGVQIEYSPLVEEIREVLTGESSPDKIFARMQQVLYLILLKKAREMQTNPTMTYDEIRTNPILVANLANTPDVINGIKDMLSVYYDLICGKSPMVNIDSADIEDGADLGDASRLIGRAARTLENATWIAQQNEYKRLADDEAYRIWFLTNILSQADDNGVVDIAKLDHSFLSGVEGAGSLQALKASATNAYKMILNADIKRIVAKYNGYVEHAISKYAKAGHFTNIRPDIAKTWKYIQDEQIERDLRPQIIALNVILQNCIDVIDKINNADRDGKTSISVSKLSATNDINIKVSPVPPLINIQVKALTDREWVGIEVVHLRAEAQSLSDAADAAGASAGASASGEEKAGGKRRRYKKTRKMKGGRRTGARRPRKTARKRRTMKRKINRRRKTRR